MYVEFRKLAEYRAQIERNVAFAQKTFDQLQAAKDELSTLQTEYDAAIKSALQSGDDDGSTVDALSVKLAEAQRLLERREHEQRIAPTIRDESISKDDVTAAWNDGYLPAFKADRFDKVTETLLAAKLAYVDAALAYHDAVKEFDDTHAETARTLSPADSAAFRYKLKRVEFQTRPETERYFITGADIYSLQQQQRPESTKGVSV